MLPFRNIVVPTDFSEPSQEGFRKACELARHFGATLLIVHVNMPVPIMPAGHGAVGFNVMDYQKKMETVAREHLEALIGEAQAGDIPMTPVVCEGDVALEIVKTAQDHGADLIVMATHGYSGWKKFILGSVTERVVRHSATPVLTVTAPEDKG